METPLVAKIDRRYGGVEIENIYLLHGTDSAHLYDPNNEPFEVEERGSYDLHLTENQARQLRDFLNKNFR